MQTLPCRDDPIFVGVEKVARLDLEGRESQRYVALAFIALDTSQRARRQGPHTERELTQCRLVPHASVDDDTRPAVIAGERRQLVTQHRTPPRAAPI